MSTGEQEGKSKASDTSIADDLHFFIVGLKCPRCECERHVVCGNCESINKFTSVSEQGAICHCGNRIDKIICDCKIVVFGKFFKILLSAESPASKRLVNEHRLHQQLSKETPEVFVWVGSVFLILLGMGGFVQGKPLDGIFFSILGILCSPPFGWFLRKRYTIPHFRNLRLILGVSLTLFILDNSRSPSAVDDSRVEFELVEEGEYARRPADNGGYLDKQGRVLGICKKYYNDLVKSSESTFKDFDSSFRFEMSKRFKESETECVGALSKGECPRDDSVLGEYSKTWWRYDSRFGCCNRPGSNETPEGLARIPACNGGYQKIDGAYIVRCEKGEKAVQIYAKSQQECDRVAKSYLSD